VDIIRISASEVLDDPHIRYKILPTLKTARASNLCFLYAESVQFSEARKKADALLCMLCVPLERCVSAVYFIIGIVCYGSLNKSIKKMGHDNSLRIFLFESGNDRIVLLGPVVGPSRTGEPEQVFYFEGAEYLYTL